MDGVPAEIQISGILFHIQRGLMWPVSAERPNRNDLIVQQASGILGNLDYVSIPNQRFSRSVYKSWQEKWTRD